MNLLARMTGVLPRPLDPVRSIKIKLGLLVVAPGAAGITYFTVNYWFPPGSTLIAVTLALFITFVLANGTTRPLREIDRSGPAMARGDYSLLVRATSRDEVGELARAFNQMSARPWRRGSAPAGTDRQRLARIAYADHGAARGAGETWWTVSLRLTRPHCVPRWRRPNVSAAW